MEKSVLFITQVGCNCGHQERDVRNCWKLLDLYLLGMSGNLEKSNSILFVS